jgi:competence protein ComEA
VRKHVARIVAWGRASAWVPLVLRSAGTVGAVVALALVGAMPMASAHVQLAARTEAAPLPSLAAQPAPVHAPAAVAEPAAPTDPAPDKLVVLNTATSDELQSLPGVGPKRAEAILTLRTRIGRFRRVEDLLRVKGIGHASLRRLKPRVLVDPPPAAPAP